MTEVPSSRRLEDIGHAGEIKALSEMPGAIWSPTAFSSALAKENSSIIPRFYGAAIRLCRKVFNEDVSEFTAAGIYNE